MNKANLFSVIITFLLLLVCSCEQKYEYTIVKYSVSSSFGESKSDYKFKADNDSAAYFHALGYFFSLKNMEDKVYENESDQTFISQKFILYNSSGIEIFPPIFSESDMKTLSILCRRDSSEIYLQIQTNRE